MFTIGVFVYYWDNEKGKMTKEYFIIKEEYIPQLNSFIDINDVDFRIFKISEVHNYPSALYIKYILQSHDYHECIENMDKVDLLIKVTL